MCEISFSVKFWQELWQQGSRWNIWEITHLIPGSEAYLVNGCEQFIMYINSKRLDEGGIWFVVFFIGGVNANMTGQFNEAYSADVIFKFKEKKIKN